MTHETGFEARVFGLVQGVFFRHHARLRAMALDISGTVENLPDGSVQVLAQGRQEDLEAFLQWLSQGPQLAHVERIDVQWLDDVRPHPGFTIVR